MNRAPDTGPLAEGGGDEASMSCVPAKDGDGYAMGFEVLRNPADDAARLEEVSLVGAKAVRLVEAVVVDVVDNTSVGLQYWPPGTVSNTTQWSARVPHTKATIPPKSHSKNLVLHLETSSVPASLKAMRIRYEVDGHEYEFETTSGLEIKDKCF